jgi:ATP-dependent DNA ligase
VILDGELTWGARSSGYHIFDIMWLDGRDLTSAPIEDRRAALATLPLRPPLHPVPSLDEANPWERARDEGWEGVVAKRRGSRYEHRRSPHWLKMKCEASQELVVGGFTDPQGARVGLGALLVGYFENDDFVFAGKIGTGFDTRLLLDLRARLDPLEIPQSPFTRATGFAAAPCALGAPGHRGRCRFPRMDRTRQAAPPTAVARTLRQIGARGGREAR